MKKIIGIFCLLIAITSHAETLKQGEDLFAKKDYVKAAKIFETLAQKGDNKAQYNIGMMYQNGLGVKKDDVKAYLWTEKATWQGNILAVHNLALMYEFGMGVKKNIPTALYYYEMGAELGNPYSQFNFGLININGQYTEINKPEAYKWMLLAEKGKVPEAKNMLEKMKTVLTKSEISEARLKSESWQPKQFNISTAPKEITNKKIK